MTKKTGEKTPQKTAKNSTRKPARQNIVTNVNVVDTTYKVSLIPDGFESGKVYDGAPLKEQGTRIGYIAENRDLDPNIIKKKIISILSVGVISPSIVASSKACLEQKLPIELREHSNGNTIITPITAETPDLEKILILCDGQHREEAICQINSNLSEDEERISNYYMAPMVDHVSIRGLLTEANIASSVWKEKDYFKYMITCQKNKGKKTDMFEWYRRKSIGAGSNRAVWYFITQSLDRAPGKETLCKAATDDKLFEKINKTANFKNGARLYDALEKKVSTLFVKNEQVARFFINLKETATNNTTKAKFFTELIAVVKGLTNAEIEALKKPEEENMNANDRSESYEKTLNDIFKNRKPNWLATQEQEAN